MIVFSELCGSKRFQEVVVFEDCNHIESNVCALLSIANKNKEDFERSISLAKRLQENEIEYAVLIADIGYFSYNLESSIYSTRSMSADKKCAENNKHEYIPLNLTLFMFAQCGASYFIMDKKNFCMLPYLQGMANYYLLDTKILALVESYFEAQEIAYWHVDSSFAHLNSNAWVGIDGIVERSLLKLQK